MMSTPIILKSDAIPGLILMAAAGVSLVAANSPLSTTYFSALQAQLGPFSLQHWINDALMAVFFLLVGLEIKREFLEGELSSARHALLPAVAAAGGMLVPALIYVAINVGDAAALRGWAIPCATDIAFALGVLSLLGSRVPVSLKVFLAALAILDDLGAVVIIALFYAGKISIPYLIGAGLVFLALLVLSRRGTRALWPYLLLGILLWVLMLRSGLHATLAGVLLAMTIPLRGFGKAAPLHRLEKLLHKPVAFFIVPVFGFANAGVSFAGGPGLAAFAHPVALGAMLGLVAGKMIGVYGAVLAAVKSGWLRLPKGATWRHMLGVALICGIGFTMSLFIGLLAFQAPELQDLAKIGVLAGSLMAGMAGYLILRRAPL